MDIQFVEDPRQMDYRQAADLLSAFGPAPKKQDPTRTESAFRQSTGVFAAVDGSRTVAVGRVLSDRYAWTLVADFAFLPEYREAGALLLERIKTVYQGHELYTWTDPEKISFFESHGFRRSRNSFTWAGENEEALDPALPVDRYYLPVGYRFECEFYPQPGRFLRGTKGTARKESCRVLFSESAENLDFGRLNEILVLAFGGRPRSESVTRDTFLNSRYLEFVYDGDKLVGCARAESDGVAQGFILNVAVDPAWQGVGLGWEVVRRLSDQMKGQNIFLNTHPGGVGFYNRKGFRRLKTALLLPAHPDMPPEVSRGFLLPEGYRFPDEF